MRRVFVSLALFVALIGVVLLIGSVGGPAPRAARPSVPDPGPEQAEEASAKPARDGDRARVVVRPPLADPGAPVPLAELRDDPNRIPGAPVVLRGVVLRAGEPAPGVAVRACRAIPAEMTKYERAAWSAARPFEPDPASFAAAKTAGSGRFVLRFARRSRVVVELVQDGEACERKLVYLPLAGDPEPVRFELERGRALSGRVVRASGEPVAGTRVVLVYGGGHRFAAVTRFREFLPRMDMGTAARGRLSARTDGRGAFSFEGVPTGVADVLVAGERRRAKPGPSISSSAAGRRSRAACSTGLDARSATLRSGWTRREPRAPTTPCARGAGR